MLEAMSEVGDGGRWILFLAACLRACLVHENVVNVGAIATTGNGASNRDASAWTMGTGCLAPVDGTIYNDAVACVSSDANSAAWEPVLPPFALLVRTAVATLCRYAALCYSMIYITPVTLTVLCWTWATLGHPLWLLSVKAAVGAFPS